MQEAIKLGSLEAGRRGSGEAERSERKANNGKVRFCLKALTIIVERVMLFKCAPQCGNR